MVKAEDISKAMLRGQTLTSFIMWIPEVLMVSWDTERQLIYCCVDVNEWRGNGFYRYCLVHPVLMIGASLSSKQLTPDGLNQYP